MKTTTSAQPSPVAPPPASAVNLSGYENNPFLVPIDGIRALFSRAQAIAITIIVLLAIGMVGNLISTVIQAIYSPEYQSHYSHGEAAPTPVTAMPTNEEIAKQIQSVPPEVWAILAIVVSVGLLVLIVTWLVGVYVKSVLDYTSARVAKNHTVTFAEAARGGLQRFGGYLWLNILVSVKVFLWSLLFIIPGIIMAVRYSLAGLSFYDKKLSASAAIKDSLALTKGAWLTTFASSTLLNMLSFGIADLLVTSGARIRLYAQFDPLTKKGEAKPAAHILSWLVPIGIVSIVVLCLLFFVLILLILAGTHSN